MKILKIEKENVANGPGIRTVIWVSGCEHHCLGCHNKNTWDPEQGKTIDKDLLKEIFKTVDNDYVSGITFTGGDPLAPYNRDDVIALAMTLKTGFKNKNIWLWTGYKFEEISMIPNIDVFDVIIDGKFEIDKRDLTLPWRGSTNQRVIDVKKSLESNKIVKIME